EGLVPTKEPFQRLFNQGMLQAFAYKDSTGRLVPVDEVDEDANPPVLKSDQKPVERIVAKMSKTLKNVVNPDDVCEQYGVDAFRLYEMFMGPLADSKPWNDRDVPGTRRFLDRVWRLFVDPDGDAKVRPQVLAERNGKPAGDALELERAFNRCLERVEDSFTHFNFNTAVAAFMEFMNTASKHVDSLDRDLCERFVCALAPFAPHIAEELWSRMGHTGGVTRAPWPELRPEYLVEDDFELVVQVMGKIRGRTRAPMAADKEALEVLARATIESNLEGKEIVKTIVVPGRLVNFVVK
ncbi:MAG: class I tRNA ligase family protein, partial [Planctomycetes bacterium]|nr:class I tRNA ligase family protein [Planctomycetota bacterium]